MLFTKGDTLCHSEKCYLKGLVVESEQCMNFEVRIYFPENKTTQDVTVLYYIRSKIILTEKYYLKNTLTIPY